MGNVIRSETPGSRRKKILRMLSYLYSQQDLEKRDNKQINDQVAFIYLSLLEIEKTIKETVDPWEKRDYWLKADKFRSEWAWINKLRVALENKQTKSGWEKIESELQFLGEKLLGIEPVKRIGNQEFWFGAYTILMK